MLTCSLSTSSAPHVQQWVLWPPRSTPEWDPRFCPWGDDREVLGKYEFTSLLKWSHFLEIRQHKKANKKPILVCASCTGHCHLKPIVLAKGSIRCQGEASYHHCFPKLLHELLPQRKRPLVLRKQEISDSFNRQCLQCDLRFKLHKNKNSLTNDNKYFLTFLSAESGPLFGL